MNYNSDKSMLGYEKQNRSHHQYWKKGERNGRHDVCGEIIGRYDRHREEVADYKEP